MAGAPARILILGAGFGGLYTALQAHRLLHGRAEITLIDRNDYFLYTPLLFQVVGGTLEPHHVARPLRSLLPTELRFVQTTVRGVDLTQRRVETETGTLGYDFLVLALGGVPNFYGMASAARHALPFKWLPDVFRLRTHVAARFAQARADPSHAHDLLRTAVIGAGCTGVELVAELHDWMHGPLTQAHPDLPPDAVELVLAEALDHLLCPMDPRLMRAAVRTLLDRRVDVRLATVVREVGPDWVQVRDPSGEHRRIACGTVVWTAGMQANPVIADLPIPHASAGRLAVTETLQLAGHPDVVVLGDLAACADPHGGILPATAQVGVQQAPAAARTLSALIAGTEPPPFRYKRKGEVVGLGRTGALVEAFGVRFMGLPAWLIGRTIHLARVPDWGDRVSVAWQWAKEVLATPTRRSSRQ